MIDWWQFGTSLKTVRIVCRKRTYKKKTILSNQTNQIKPPQPNCLNQSAITKPTQPYLPKQIYQTKFIQPNLKPKCIKPIYKIKSLNSNLSKQTYKTQLYQIKHTKTIWNFLHNFKNLFWVKLPHPSLFKDSIFRNSRLSFLGTEVPANGRSRIE